MSVKLLRLLPKMDEILALPEIVALCQVYGRSSVTQAARRAIDNKRDSIQKGDINDFYPGRWVIEEMYQMNIPVTISSDAHVPGMLEYGFNRAIATLKEIGYQTVRIFRNKQWTDVPLI